MDDYRFAAQQNDGSWLFVDFQCPDDDDAVAFGLRNRTAHACELFCADRLLATFDGLIAPARPRMFVAHESGRHQLERMS